MSQHPLPGMRIAASFAVSYAVPMPTSEPLCEEAAGQVGNAIAGAARAVASGAGRIWTAVSQGFNNSGVGRAAANFAQGGASSGWASVLGRAAVGAILSAGSAYLMGVRGSGLWTAGLSGGTVAGLGAWSQMQTPQLGATQGAPTPSTPGTGLVAPGVGTEGIGTPAPTQTGGGGLFSSVTGAISNIFSGSGRTLNGLDLNRVLAAVTGAALSGRSMGQLDSVVAARKAELDKLAATDRAAYDRQIAIAKDILNKAYASDPQWAGRMAMADVAGMGERELNSVLRNQAVAQGGYNTGAARATERKAQLGNATDRALAYNREYKNAEGEQARLLAQAAGLMGPNPGEFDRWKAGTELDLAQAEAHGAQRADLGRLFSYAITPAGNYDELLGTRTDTQDGHAPPRNQNNEYPISPGG